MDNAFPDFALFFPSLYLFSSVLNFNTPLQSLVPKKYKVYREYFGSNTDTQFGNLKILWTIVLCYVCIRNKIASSLPEIPHVSH